MNPIRVLYGPNSIDFAIRILKTKNAFVIDPHPKPHLAEALAAPWLLSPVEPDTDTLVFCGIKNNELQLLVHAFMAETITVSPAGKRAYVRPRPDIIILLDDNLDTSTHSHAVLRRIHATEVK